MNIISIMSPHGGNGTRKNCGMGSGELSSAVYFSAIFIILHGRVVQLRSTATLRHTMTEKCGNNDTLTIDSAGLILCIAQLEEITMTLGPLQSWAITGLDNLAINDPDRASQLNGVGFNKLDGDFGRSLLDSYNKYGRLSQKQWLHAIRLTNKYRRQVGNPPEDFTFPNL